MADEYISKQRAKDLMGCCLASAKAEYKAAKDEFTKARFGDYISSIQSMIDVVGAVEAADVQPFKSKWCPPLMGQGKCDTYCERCHGKIMRNSTGIFEETPYCPHCGADMRGEQNDD